MNMQASFDLATEAEEKKEEIALIEKYAEARLAA
jgi:hypothetical protein